MHLGPSSLLAQGMHPWDHSTLQAATRNEVAGREKGGMQAASNASAHGSEGAVESVGTTD